MIDLDVEAPGRPARRTVRRVVTSTPLARQHEHTLAGRERRPRPIPWASFDRRRFPRPALELACHAQRNLATGEYGAITLFARLASALALHGAPIDLVTAAARVPGDEARHADLALRAAAAYAGCGSDEIVIELEQGALEGVLRAPVDQETLDLQMTEVAAISETLAAALLTGCLRRASEPMPRALFSNLVSDEIHHARLGWYYLAWRAPQWSRAERQRVADRAGAVVAGIEQRFSTGRDAPAGSRRAARALGVLDTPGQRAVVQQVMQDEIVPGLDALGLGASHAWKRRARAPRRHA